MSRNTINANSRVFDKLRLRSLKYKQDSIPRYISTSKTEKAQLAEVCFHADPTFMFSDSSAIFFAKLETKIFVIARGLRKSLTSDQITLIEMTAGLFTAVVSELPIEVASHVTDAELEEKIFFPLEEIDSGPIEPISYSVEEIQPFFEAFDVYEVSENSPLLQDGLSDRIALHLLATTGGSIRLPYREATITRFLDAAISPASNLPHRLLLRAYTEHRWDQAFLSIYRCLEQLFPFSKISRLKIAIEKTAKNKVAPILLPPNGEETANEASLDTDAQLKSSPWNSLQLHELAVLTENILGWRAKEDDAISDLLLDLQKSLIEEICLYTGIDPKHEKAANKAADALYRMRNRAVHFRPIHANEAEPTDEEWESVTTWLLRAVCALYEQLGTELRAAPFLLQDKFRYSIKLS